MEVRILRGVLPNGYGSYGSGGYGYGSYGYGDGYGSYGSDGYGYGDGDGSGYGDGDGDYWRSYLAQCIARWSDARQARIAALAAAGAQIAFWGSGADGRPCNGGSADPVTDGLIQTVTGPLVLCRPGTLHATLRPEKWKGVRWWIVALTGTVIGDDEKYGALTREILGEITS